MRKPRLCAIGFTFVAAVVAGLYITASSTTHSHRRAQADQHPTAADEVHKTNDSPRVISEINKEQERVRADVMWKLFTAPSDNAALVEADVFNAATFALCTDPKNLLQSFCT